MATAENAKLNIEAGQNFVPIEQMADSGDKTTFNLSGGESQLSAADGVETIVRLDGLTSGGVPSSNGVADQITITAGTYNLDGESLSVVADVALGITRGGSSHIIVSVIVDADGIFEELGGTTATSFSETRGAAGGPPFIPVGAIEICQVRYSSLTPAIVLDTEIFQVTGQHVERSTSPLFTLLNSTGDLTFISALPSIHTASASRGVWIQYSTPIFSEVADASAFVPPENSDSSTSTQVYGRTVSATSSTLNQGSFNALLNDGISDLVIQQKGQTLWFEFFPNRFSTNSLILTQGKLGVTRSFPADDLINAACTITAGEEATEEVT
jgi:hypothetical protein